MTGTFLLFLITYCIGYIAGYFSQKSSITLSQAISSTSNTLKNVLPDKRIPAGILKRPTAKELHDRNVPQYVKDGREAMKETLDAIPELQEHKALLKKIQTMQP